MKILRTKQIFKMRNPNTSQGLITLGLSNAFAHGLYEFEDYYCTLKYLPEKRVGTIVMPSAPGTGKTAMGKRVTAQLSEIEPERPIFIIDMQGADWKGIKEKASYGAIATRLGEDRWGYGKNLESYTPSHLAGENYIGRDKTFTLCWRDMDSKDWKFFIESDGGAKTWTYGFIKFMKENKSRIKSLNELKNHIALAIGKQETTLIPSNLTIQELRKWWMAVDMIQESRAFSEEKDDKILDFLTRVRKPGSVTVVNFHSDDGELTMLYVSIMLRKFYKHFLNTTNKLKSVGKRPNTPFLIIEEMNFLSPAKPGVHETPGEYWVRIIVTKAEKAGFLSLLIMQDLHDISSKTRRALLQGTILTSLPTNKDRSAMAEFCSQEVMDVVDNLTMMKDPRTNTVEWVKIERKTAWPFFPLAPQVEFFNRHANLPVEA